MLSESLVRKIITLGDSRNEIQYHALSTSAPLVPSKARAPVVALAVVLAVILAVVPALLLLPLAQHFYTCGHECPCHLSPLSYYSPLPFLALALPHLPLAL